MIVNCKHFDSSSLPTFHEMVNDPAMLFSMFFVLHCAFMTTKQGIYPGNSLMCKDEIES